GIRPGSGVYSISRHRLSAGAATAGKPKVAASPLMSWAALNKASRLSGLKPRVRASRRAASSRSHSAAIQFANSPESCASASSARVTGSSAGSAAGALRAPAHLAWLRTVRLQHAPFGAGFRRADRGRRLSRPMERDLRPVEQFPAAPLLIDLPEMPE